MYNPHFLHGTKTYVYELWEDLGGSLPEAIAVPVGNGTLLLGASLAINELHAHGLIADRPQLIAVQAEAVSPLAAAFHAGKTTSAPNSSRHSSPRLPPSPRASPSRGHHAPARSYERYASRAGPSSP